MADMCTLQIEHCYNFMHRLYAGLCTCYFIMWVQHGHSSWARKSLVTFQCLFISGLIPLCHHILLYLPLAEIIPGLECFISMFIMKSDIKHYLSHELFRPTLPLASMVYIHIWVSLCASQRYLRLCLDLIFSIFIPHHLSPYHPLYLLCIPEVVFI